MKDGFKVSKKVEYFITISKVYKDVPLKKEEEFFEWLQSQPLKHSTGQHLEYFAIDEDYENDIGVVFVISI